MGLWEAFLALLASHSYHNPFGFEDVGIELKFWDLQFLLAQEVSTA